MSNRRAFLLAAAAAPILPAALVAQTAPVSPSPSPSAPPADGQAPVVLALTEAVRARFAAHLAPGDMEAVRKQVEANLQAAARLRAVTLRNSDEPVTAYAASRAPQARK